MSTFNNIVFSTDTQSPASLVLGLSANDSSFVLVTAGTKNSKTVAGILFNVKTLTSVVTGASGADDWDHTYTKVLTGSEALATERLTITGGTVFKVHPQYHGEQVALYYTDRSSTLFTVNTATAGQTVGTTVTFDNRGPIERRLFAVGL